LKYLKDNLTPENNKNYITSGWRSRKVAIEFILYPIKNNILDFKPQKVA